MNMKILMSRTYCEHFMKTLCIAYVKIEVKIQQFVYMEMVSPYKKDTENLTVIYSIILIKFLQ